MIRQTLRSRGDYFLNRYPSVVHPVDAYTARYLGSKSKVEPEMMFDLVLLMGVALRANQVSLSKNEIEGKTLPELLESLFPGLREQTVPDKSNISDLSVPRLPDTEQVSDRKVPGIKVLNMDHVLKSGLVYIVEGKNESLELSRVDAPLILHGNWIYFRRQWVSEWYILRCIGSRLLERPLVSDTSFFSKINEMFYDESGRTSGQIQAAMNANTYPFSIITGGPGTGKTRTIVGFLASLMNFCPELDIVLCAPTGKAASRMIESIKHAVETDDRFTHLSSVIPQQSSTIHRLLGWNPLTGTFRYHEGNPIQADLILVDEASMIDLVMFSRLMRSISAGCRIVLLGDKDQLASVEAGSVFGDLIRAGVGGGSPGLRSVITKLTHSWRFKPESGLGLLAESINNGDDQLSWNVLHADTDAIHLVTSDYMDHIMDTIKVKYEAVLRHTKFDIGDGSTGQLKHHLQQAVDILGGFQVLTAHRLGKYGSVKLNKSIDQQLAKSSTVEWYAGRPVIATENDYDHGVFNGDVGITVQVGTDYWVYFGTDDKTGATRLFKTSQLGGIESAWALTVHKSQGSEYRDVLLVLPDYESPVLSRELLYTAVTRARESVQIVAKSSVWTYAVKTTLYKEGGFLNRFTF